MNECLFATQLILQGQSLIIIIGIIQPLMKKKDGCYNNCGNETQETTRLIGGAPLICL